MNSMNKNPMFKEIEDHAAYLKLPAIKRNFREEVKEAALKDLSYDEFLYRLLQQEVVKIRECKTKQDPKG